MPSITLNKTVFEKLVGKKLKLDELKDRISMLGTDLESIEGNEINVEIFPNRPDLLSEQGLARAFSSFIGMKTGLRTYDIKKSGKKVIVDKSVTMRPYTACAIVKGVKFNDERIREIMQIQEKLAMTHGRNRKKSAYGVYPTKDINFPINYIAKDPKTVTFHPLGMPRPMRADDVEELHPKGIEYKWVAKGWKKYPFFIDNKDNIMCMLPYTNSNNTGKVDENTTEVFIECTGIDFKNVSVALNIFVAMLADMGGEIYSMDIEYPNKTITTPNLTPEKIKLDVNYVNKNLGLELTEKQAITLLTKMGFGYDSKSKKVLIPAYRADILHQVDLIEDIAIAYGYENFDEIIPKVATIGEESNIEILKRKVAELLVGLKLTELYTYNITSDELTEKKTYCKKPIMLSNSLSEEYNCLRNNMISSLLDTLAHNKHNDYPQHIFDIGTVFTKDSKEETGIKEQSHLSVALCEDRVDFTRIKQILDYIFSNLDVKYEVKESSNKTFMEGRVGEIIVKGKTIGTIGELNPEVLANFQLEYPVAAFELNIDLLNNLI